MMCGGWTILLAGATDRRPIDVGTTILNGIKADCIPDTTVEYNKDASFTDKADVGIVVVGETPYAEGLGDKADLSLSETDVKTINAMKPLVGKLIVVILSGRPLVITDQLTTRMRGWNLAARYGRGRGRRCAVWRPPFVGNCRYTWPRTTLNCH